LIDSLFFPPLEKPYFNEPSYEQQMNTPNGKAASKAYNQVIRVAAVQWAMVDMLRNPPKGFEEVIKNHFELRREAVLAEMEQWVAEGKGNSSHQTSLRSQVKNFKEELVKRYGALTSTSAQPVAAGSSGAAAKAGDAFSSDVSSFLYRDKLLSTSSPLVHLQGDSTASLKYSGNSSWCTVISQGVVAPDDSTGHTWRVRIDRTLKGTLMVGILSTRSKVAKAAVASGGEARALYIGGESQSYGYLGISGSIWNNSKKRPWMRAGFKQGDVVTVTLKQNTLSFAVNGVNRGLGFTTVKSGLMYHFGCSFFHEDDQVTIVE
jgi:SPRY domain